MLCEHYKDALVEEAASGREPRGELRAHLDDCAACRAAFAGEQRLFSSIDAGLHVTSNSEVPASLLPRVRAGLGEAAASPHRWMQALTFAAAGVALAAIVFLATRPDHARLVEPARQIPSAPAHELRAQERSLHWPETSGITVASNPHGAKAGRHSVSFRSVAATQPQVIVPPDEREALARFVSTLGVHSELAVALTSPAPEKKNAVVSIEPLRIEDIELKPLKIQETEASDLAGEKR